MKEESKKSFKEGMKAGIPIALGYFGVSMALGLAAKNAGLSVFQGFLASALTNASAGQHQGFILMAEEAGYLEFVVFTIVVNARYILMGLGLSQKFGPDARLIDKGILGFYLTDEYFALAINEENYLRPAYIYGAIAVASPFWAIGTALGIQLGNVLPIVLVDALALAIYGMYLAIIIPPAREDKTILSIVLISFIFSFAFARLPYLREISDGFRIIILTLIIAGLFAHFRPIEEK